MSAATPSMTALANRVRWLPASPLSSEPTTAMEPTQNTRLALTKPRAKSPPPADPSANRASIQRPRDSSRASMASHSPTTPPTTRLRITTGRLSLLRALLPPMRSTHRASPWSTVWR